MGLRIKAHQGAVADFFSFAMWNIDHGAFEYFSPIGAASLPFMRKPSRDSVLIKQNGGDLHPKPEKDGTRMMHQRGHVARHSNIQRERANDSIE